VARAASRSATIRGHVRRKRRTVIGQRLRQLLPAPPALVAEFMLLDLLLDRAIDIQEWAAAHLAISLLLAVCAKWIGRRIRRNQVAWYLFVATAGLGPIGPFAAIATGVLLIAFHRDVFDFQAWYASLFPAETRSRVRDLYESLIRRERRRSRAGVESFADILSSDDAAKKRIVIGLLTRHFRPGFAPALKLALTDDDPSVRTQAATAVATIEGRFLARAQILQRKVRERPSSFRRRHQLARHYDEYAFTGLLDAERERDNRIRALEAYQDALKVRPRDAGIWLAIGRLLVRERRYDAAASWFTVAEARGLLSADMVLWQLEALFRLGRYDKLRECLDRHGALLGGGAKLPPQVPEMIRLWSGGAPAKAGSA
jgi:polysaccharide biosynthesis protein PelE